MASTVWKGFLSFGLVSFPVRLYSAARPETIHFNLLHKKDQSRVKEVWYCAEEDKPISRDDMVKGYQYAKNEYVVIDEEDLKKIAPSTATTMDILEFVKADEVDPIFLEASYYLAPEEAISKPYNLLLEALTETNYYAVAKVAMHMREHVVIIRPTKDGMVLHTMYFVDELHKANAAGRPKKGSFSKKEMDLAKSLIETLASSFKPEQFHDEYRANVEKLIDAKMKGRKAPAVAKHRKPAEVTDIFEALKKSLKQAAPKKKSRKAA